MPDNQQSSPRHLVGEIPLPTHGEGAWTVDLIPGFGNKVQIRSMGGIDTFIEVHSGTKAVNQGPSGWHTRRDENILTWPALLRTINEADPSHLDPKLNELRELIARATGGTGTA